MDSFSSCKQYACKIVADRKHPLSFMKTHMLQQVVLGSLVFLSGILVDGISGGEPQNTSETALQGDGRLVGHTRLREGTRVPPTLGTVVALGPRRWAFVPATGTGRGVPRRGGDTGPLNDTVNARAEQRNREPFVLLAENLMLQRIVQAIREDELDNLWQLTGHVTEYFGQNRLTILTAQRGQSKQLPPAAGR